MFGQSIPEPCLPTTGRHNNVELESFDLLGESTLPLDVTKLVATQISIISFSSASVSRSRLYETGKSG